MAIDYARVGLKAGLEIHQQLDTTTKLFCKCPTVLREKKDARYSFIRYLRASRSELGEVDEAARAEAGYNRTFIYKAYDTTCLVESDEEPPCELNPEAIDIALEIALMLNMNVVDEIHTMRKIVIDGSNTCGFQRTALIATDGWLATEEGRVRVDSLCLEEDAAQKIEETEDGCVVYSLDRLGIPLVEIGTAPDIQTPEQARKVAEQIGMILRSTGRVKRGLGTIRQDINISIDGGARVEIKGVQNLRMIGEIVTNEVKRQLKLMELSRLLNDRGSRVEHRIVDLSDIFRDTASRVIRRAGGLVYGACLRGFAGIPGTELQPGRRFGSELADFAARYGTGLMHTDELPAYGITDAEIARMRSVFDASDSDCIVIVAADNRLRAENALRAVLNRAEEAMRGIPEETRRALPDGSSAYMRPLPGAARMYPETDVPPVEISTLRLKEISSQLPETFEQRIMRYRRQFGLNDELASKIARSSNCNLFEAVVESCEVSPTLVARTLTDTMVELMREGVELDNLTERHILDIFRLLAANEFGKEAIPDIMRFIASNPDRTIERAVEELDLRASIADVERFIADTVALKRDFILERGERAVGPLMGIVMREFRGKVDGKELNMMLRAKVLELLADKGD